jgi:hypothetical protein
VGEDPKDRRNPPGGEARIRQAENEMDEIMDLVRNQQRLKGIARRLEICWSIDRVRIAAQARARAEAEQAAKATPVAEQAVKKKKRRSKKKAQVRAPAQQPAKPKKKRRWATYDDPRINSAVRWAVKEGKTAKDVALRLEKLKVKAVPSSRQLERRMADERKNPTTENDI